MTPPGLAKIEAAQLDGSWSALDAVEALEIPPDLERALAETANGTRQPMEDVASGEAPSG